MNTLLFLAALTLQAPLTSLTPMTPPAATLPEVLRYEKRVLDLEQENTNLRASNAFLTAKIEAYEIVLGKFLVGESTDRYTAALKDLDARAVKALGGDPAKGDRVDWATGTLIKGGQ